MTTQCKNIDVVFDFVYATTRANVFAGAIRLLNFNISYGVGSQSSTMELDIAVDQCLSAGGVGVQIPDVGRAVNFLCPSSGFSFGGIIHTATYSESGSGFIFKFKIIDPRKLIDNFSVLLKDFYCPLQNMPNFFNFAYEYEGGAALCPPGIDYENFPTMGNCANFGTSGPGSYSSKNGVSLAKVLTLIDSNPNIRIFTSSGVDKLRFDASRLISRLPEWSKTDSTSATLGNILDQAADDSSCDIVLTLEGDTIVVWPIDRTVNITQSPVDEIIRQSKNSGTLVSSETGAQEIYEPSNKVVIGDKIHYLAEIESAPLMMLGYTAAGDPVWANQDEFEVTINTEALQTVIGGAFPATFKISEKEIIASASEELWSVYGLEIAANTLCSSIITAIDAANPPAAGGTTLRDAMSSVTAQFNNLGIVGPLPQGANPVENFRNVRANILNASVLQISLIKWSACWKWWNEWIAENYGTKWLVPLDTLCINPKNRNKIIQGEGGSTLVSDVPVGEGYPSPSQGAKGNILGLSIPDGNSVIFEQPDRKFNGFIKIPSNQTINITLRAAGLGGPGPVTFKLQTFGLPAGNHVIEDDNVYLAASYAGEIHNINDKAYALIRLGSKIQMMPDPPFPEALGNPGMLTLGTVIAKATLQNLVGGAPNNNDSSVQMLNVFKITPPAGRPTAVCLPMRSNVYTYGPWTSTGNTIGSTEVILDTTLNPWNYDGYDSMNEIGQGLADQGLRQSNKEFSGSVTIAEPPAYNVQYFIQNYSIVLDSINVNYGSQGVTSTYSFRSQTPKFGEWGKTISDLTQKSVVAGQETNAFIKEIKKKTNAEIQSLRGGIEQAKFNQFLVNPRNANATPHQYLIGFYNNNEQNNDSDGGSSPSPIPSKPSLNCEEINNSDTSDKSGTPGSNSESKDGGSTIQKLLEVGVYPSYDVDSSYSKERFYSRGLLSLDGLFSPVSIKGREGWLSPYGKYTEPSATSDPIYRSRPVMPPLNKSKKLNIHQKYMNPMVSKKMLTTWDDRKASSTAGLQIFWIGHGDSIKDTITPLKKENAEDFGFMSLRGPLVLQSWGYDTEGKPIPNIIDSPKKAEEGTFNRNGTKNKFMTNWLSNPKTWPVGPIDLRWDRDRGVWVCPPQERVVVAQLLETLSPLGSAKASLLNPSANGKLFYDNYSIWGDNGENIAQSIQSLQIEVYDFLKKEIPKGARVYAVNEDGKYVVIESSGPVKLSSTTTTDLDCETTESESCSDSCGLRDCLTDLGSGPAVLGLDENNCLTLYEFTECEETSSPSP